MQVVEEPTSGLFSAPLGAMVERHWAHALFEDDASVGSDREDPPSPRWQCAEFAARGRMRGRGACVPLMRGDFSCATAGTGLT